MASVIMSMQVGRVDARRQIIIHVIIQSAPYLVQFRGAKSRRPGPQLGGVQPMEEEEKEEERRTLTCRLYL